MKFLRAQGCSHSAVKVSKTLPMNYITEAPLPRKWRRTELSTPPVWLPNRDHAGTNLGADFRPRLDDDLGHALGQFSVHSERNMRKSCENELVACQSQPRSIDGYCHVRNFCGELRAKCYEPTRYKHLICKWVGRMTRLCPFPALLCRVSTVRLSLEQQLVVSGDWCD
jgi:hypothetical protein